MRITLVPESLRADNIKLKGKPIVTGFDDLHRDSSDWLWPDRIPAGKVTLFSGDPEMGKSYVSLDIAARVMTGAAWPGEVEGQGGEGRGEDGARNTLREDIRRIDAAHRFGDVAFSSSDSAIPSFNSSLIPRKPSLRPPGSVLLLNAEDPKSTIWPRLEKMGADLNRVKFLSGVEVGESKLPYSLCYGVDMIEETMATMQNCKLVVIDPIMSFVGGISSSNTNQVRAVLDPLKGLAERTGAAVILVNHLCKKKGSPMYRSIGSISIIGMARMAWAFTACTKREGVRLMMPLKNNLTDQKEGLSYRIADGRVIWDTEAVDVTTREAFDADPTAALTNALNWAKDWLSDQLTDGEWMTVKELEARAKTAGISWGTVRRAKSAMGEGIEIQHKSVNDPWEWRLSESAQVEQWMKERGRQLEADLKRLRSG